MKGIIRKLFLSILITAAILCAFYFLWLSPRYVIPILMYHRFGYENNSLFVTPENFSRQMEYLKNNGYNVIPLNELVEGIKNKKCFSRKKVIITIDDGYRDNYTYAYPVLKEYGFPATIFIISGFIDKRQDYLTWVQIDHMLKDNISIGGHTKSHTYLPAIKDKQILWEEIAGSKKEIEDKIRKHVDYFCYPFGGFTEEVKIMLKQARYKGGCTTNRGFAKSNRDVYELKRIKVTNSDTTKPLNFWAKLSGYYNLFRTKRKGG